MPRYRPECVPLTADPPTSSTGYAAPRVASRRARLAAATDEIWTARLGPKDTETRVLLRGPGRFYDLWSVLVQGERDPRDIAITRLIFPRDL